MSRMLSLMLNSAGMRSSRIPRQGINKKRLELRASPALADYPANATLLPERLDQKNVYGRNVSWFYELRISASNYKAELS